MQPIIDLSYKPKKKEEKKEEPTGFLILSLFPFALLLYIVLTASFLNGIF